MWAELLEIDRRRVWHPYGPMPAVTPPLPVVSASGVRLTLADGRELIDGMASWWCAIHGYRVPSIDAAVRSQMDRMAHVMFGGLTHEGAIRLAERLTDWTGLDHVFFADSGSVSVEVAIKLALQYWHGERRTLLTWRGGYHGDTFGAMAVCDPDGGMHSMWKGSLAEHVFAPLPRWDEEWAAEVRSLFEGHEFAGVIVEPIVQGAGGMRFHPPECVALLRSLCDEHGVPLILDEIATGFGRTGSLFAGGRADIMCVGQGADRRLHDAGGDVMYGGGRGAPERAAHARADLHGQPAGDRRRDRVNRSLGERDVAAGCCADRARSYRGVGLGAGFDAGAGGDRRDRASA